jgi:glutamate/tyrosine decarboxylase-like PLP-dependent enzyme
MAIRQIAIPAKGISREEALGLLRSMRGNDQKWQRGRMFGFIYYANQEVESIAREAYSEYLVENALSPFSFPSLLKMETEVLSMTASLLYGPDAVGSLTSGGSESIFMAMKTARDWARQTKPQATQPEMIMPITAHPAFNKAAHYLGIKAVLVPITSDCKVDIAAVRKVITPNTIMLVGTAVTYPHGVIDPIEQLSDIALEHRLWLHTDACLGGWIIPFLEKEGYPIAPFDFRLAGVCSISADIHKYGYIPKGASALLYRNADFRKHQFFAYADWPGGVYGTPTVAGARSGGAMASAWAVLHFLGEEGFRRLARQAMSATQRMIEGIQQIPNLYVLGQPDATVFAIASERINVYDLRILLKQRGWHVEAQQLPPSLHFTISPIHAEIVDEFLADLRAASAEASNIDDDSRSQEAVMYGLMGTLPDRSEARELALGLLNDIYKIQHDG